jgi:HSP20 family protein
MRSEMDRFFDDFWGRRPFSRPMEVEPFSETRGWTTPVDMIDRPDEVLIQAMVPGVEKKDISISVSDGMLRISGERKADSEIKEDDYYCCEHTYGKFYRSINLPTAVKSDKIKATLKNGILEIHLPKAEEVKSKPVEIAVE